MRSPVRLTKDDYRFIVCSVCTKETRVHKDDMNDEELRCSYCKKPFNR